MDAAAEATRGDGDLDLHIHVQPDVVLESRTPDRAAGRVAVQKLLGEVAGLARSGVEARAPQRALKAGRYLASTGRRGVQERRRQDDVVPAALSRGLPSELVGRLELQ